MTRKKISILITGGAGYIGSHLIKLLISKNFFVVSLDKKEALKSKHNRGCIFIKGDVENKNILKNIFKKYDIDIVLHLASLISVEESMIKPNLYFKNNVVKAINLLEAMKEAQVNKIVFTSSAAVYSKSGEEINPNNIYGLTKSTFEDVLKYYNKNNNFSCIIFRLFNVSGADESGELRESHKPETHLIPCVIKSILNGRPVKIYSQDYPTEDGSCIRDYIHVNDVARAFLFAIPMLNNNIYDIFDIGSGRGYSVKDVVNKCYSILKEKPNIVFKNKRAGDSAVLISDSIKAAKKLRWKPKFNLKDIILHTINSQTK